MAMKLRVPGRAATKRRGLNRQQRRTVTFFLFISPWLIMLVAVGIIPLVLGVLTSLTNYDGLNLASVKFVGLRNYARAFADPDAAIAVRSTVYWTLLSLPAGLVCTFALAALANQPLKGVGLFRTLYYLPSVVPAVAAVTIWRIVLDKNAGLLNSALDVVRPGTAVGWMTDYILLGLTTIALWTGLGSGMVVFLAGLQNIPDELVEAARVDGANAVRVFRHVTLPLMTPVVFFQLVMGLIGAFQQLNYPLLLSTHPASGLPANAPRPIYLFMIHTYRQIFVYQRFGYGTALLWLLFVAVVLLTAVVFKSADYWVYSDVSKEGKQA